MILINIKSLKSTELVETGKYLSNHGNIFYNHGKVLCMNIILI